MTCIESSIAFTTNLLTRRMPTNELEQGQTENGSAIQWFLTAYDATVLADFISVKANAQNLPPSEFPLLN